MQVINDNKLVCRVESPVYPWLNIILRPAFVLNNLSSSSTSLHGVVDCLFIFKVTEPSSIPYGTHSACAKRATYPDPPPVIPVPESRVAEVTSLPSPRSLGHICGGPRPNRLSSVPGSASGPKCFQVLGLSPSLLQNPML